MIKAKQAARPLLVLLEHVKAKVTLFKIVDYMKHVEKFKEVSVSNDLTKSKRARRKRTIWNEAKNGDVLAARFLMGTHFI